MTKKTDPAALAAAYERARANAQKLANVTDQLNSKIAEAEAALAALGLGVAGSVDISTDQESRDAFTRLVSFHKDEKTWRLFYEYGSEHQHPDTWASTPLANAPRNVRMEAVAALPKLLANLIENAEKEAKAVEVKVSELASFVEFTKRLGGGK